MMENAEAKQYLRHTAKWVLLCARTGLDSVGVPTLRLLRQYDQIIRRFQVAVHGSAALNEFYESRCTKLLKMLKA